MTYTQRCETCFGEGQIVIFIDRTDNLANIEYELCEDCNGKGEVWVEENDDRSK